MKKRLFVIIPFLLTIMFGGLFALTRQTPDFSAEKTLQIAFLDVGQGDSTFITFPGGKTALIDAGEADAGEIVTGYIKGSGHDRIDYLVCTHPHSDHIGGMQAVIEQFDIGEIYMPKVAHTSRTFEKLLLAIQEKGLKIHAAKAGVVITPEPETAMTFLAPNSDSYEDLNNYSAVIRLTCGKAACLLTGDAEQLSEDEILDSGQDVQAEVLKVGHHGSSTSSSRRFLEAVNPDWAIISAGTDNSYGHPHKETIQALKAQGVKEILRTDRLGTVVLYLDSQGIWRRETEQ